MSSLANKPTNPQLGQLGQMTGPSSLAEGAAGGPSAGLREQVAATQGYDAQRALVSPGPAAGGALTPEEATTAPPTEAEGQGATAEAVGPESNEAAPEQGGAAQDGATQNGATQDGATQDGAVQDSAATGDLTGDAAETAGPDPNSGMLAAGPGGGRRGSRGRGTRGNRARWPGSVPVFPSRAVWKEYGPSKADPGDWYLRSGSADAFKEARAHNQWLASLSKPQLDAVRMYRYCKVGVMKACRILASPATQRALQDTISKAQVDKVIGTINTTATRLGAAGALIDKAMARAESGKQRAALKRASGVLSRASRGLKAITSLLGQVTTVAGLYTDVLSLVSAASELSTKGVTDETLQKVWGAAAVLLKDVAITVMPPPIGATLTIANEIMCEIEPQWVEKTVGLFLGDKPEPKRAPAPAPKRPQNGGSIADQINWR